MDNFQHLGNHLATLIPAAKGFGQDRKIRSAHFFEPAEQPVEVTMAVSEADARRLSARLMEGLNIFFVISPIEFGMTGDLP